MRPFVNKEAQPSALLRSIAAIVFFYFFTSVTAFAGTESHSNFDFDLNPNHSLSSYSNATNYNAAGGGPGLR